MDFLGVVKATKNRRDETNIMDFLGIVKAAKNSRDKAIKDAADAADAAKAAEKLCHYICSNAVFNKKDEFGKPHMSAKIEAMEMYTKDVRDAKLADLRRMGDAELAAQEVIDAENAFVAAQKAHGKAWDIWLANKACAEKLHVSHALPWAFCAAEAAVKKAADAKEAYLAAEKVYDDALDKWYTKMTCAEKLHGVFVRINLL